MQYKCFTLTVIGGGRGRERERERERETDRQTETRKKENQFLKFKSSSHKCNTRLKSL